MLFGIGTCRYYVHAWMHTAVLTIMHAPLLARAYIALALRGYICKHRPLPCSTQDSARNIERSVMNVERIALCEHTLRTTSEAGGIIRLARVAPDPICSVSSPAR